MRKPAEFRLNLDQYLNALEEMDKKQTDRGAALIAAAILERHLEFAIKNKLSK